MIGGYARPTNAALLLGSKIFSRASGLARLLRYLCEKYFEGQADQIKEYTIAVEFFDNFAPRIALSDLADLSFTDDMASDGPFVVSTTYLESYAYRNFEIANERHCPDGRLVYVERTAGNGEDITRIWGLVAC